MFSKFAFMLKDSGLRKLTSGLYMFTALCLLIIKLKLPAQAFVDICQWLILAMFGGNALEHFFDKDAKKVEEKKEIPSAS